MSLYRYTCKYIYECLQCHTGSYDIHFSYFDFNVHNLTILFCIHTKMDGHYLSDSENVKKKVLTRLRIMQKDENPDNVAAKGKMNYMPKINHDLSYLALITYLVSDFYHNNRFP